MSCIRSACVAVTLALCGTAQAGAVTYSFNLSPGTTGGAPITNLVVLERLGTQVFVDYFGSINGTGPVTLTHTAPFSPEYSLLLGIDIIPSVPNLRGTFEHPIIFMDAQFASSTVAGHRYSETFTDPNFGYMDLIDNVVAASAGDQTAEDALIEYFTVGDGTKSAFRTGDAFTIMEFTIGDPIGRSVPEPGSAVLFTGLCALGAMFSRRRAAKHAAPDIPKCTAPVR